MSSATVCSPKLAAVVKGGEEMTRPIREVQPGSLPDLFEGDQLVVLGQYTDDTAEKLVLSGNFLGKERTFEFPFEADKATTRNAFVPRLWASRKIASLIEEIRLNCDGAPATVGGVPNPKTKELVDEIVRLSTKWGILTEYTAFLALEPGAVAGLPGDTPIALRFASPSGGAAATAT